ncbi:hypothetical protein H257_14622 [Aphanomyces astaci]|uniref:Elongation of fatty acids protein n=1 Tax=Aphanomyces astaci TaxID=112090 RepID=W4FQN5_APHAT|nr:hypothetical protein H257_14622 [Aphanomyces astaci]ETV69797.1 hypothetical protein H257_14622 [Aphanomyces astaci]|eukprot:XP_009840811.1 hypothetical protein H257_14622 [Aphanomyces astaci]
MSVVDSSNGVLAYYDTVVGPFFADNGPVVPVVCVLLYLTLSGPGCRVVVNVLGLEMSAEDKKLRKRHPFVTALSVVHNFLLAVYSGWTFYNSASIFYHHYQTNPGYSNFMCDASGKHWSIISWWFTHFYVSKFYEFVDSWIVYLKGDKPILLQTYHHAGIILCMYCLIQAQATAPALVVTSFNSFIHTIMYTYYLFATLGYRSPYAKYLTMAQLTQFLVGISLTVPSYFVAGCNNTNQTYGIAAIHVYTVILIYLFAMFFAKRYATTKPAPKKVN